MPGLQQWSEERRRIGQAASQRTKPLVDFRTIAGRVVEQSVKLVNQSRSSGQSTQRAAEQRSALRPKASLRALGQQIPLIQRAAERRGSFAAPRLGAPEVLLPKARRFALGR